MSNNPTLTNNTSTESNDAVEWLDLSYIWSAILSSWQLILGVMSLFTVISLILVLTLPKQWEATATLHIGRMVTSNGDQKLIEDPTQTVERIKLIGFKQNILNRLHLPTEKGIDKRTDLLLTSLKGSVIQNTEFVSLSARGYSATDAAKTMQSTIVEIETVHAAVTKAAKDHILKESQETTKNLNAATIDLANLKNQLIVSGAYKATAAFAPSIIAINFLAAKEADVRMLQNQQIQYNARLAAFDEQATAIINIVNVSKKPVSPVLSTFLVAGALLGLLVGGWVALLRYKNPVHKKV